MRSHVMQRNHAGALWAVSLLAVMLVLTGGPAVARAEEAGPRFLAGEYSRQYEATLIAEFDRLLPDMPPWKKRSP